MLKLGFSSLAHTGTRSLSLAVVTALCAVSFGVGCGGEAASGGGGAGAAGSHAGTGGSAGAPALGSAGKSAAGAAGAGVGTAGAAGTPASSAGAAGTAVGGGSSGGAAVDPALDQACTSACAKQTTLACSFADGCHDACLAKATESASNPPTPLKCQQLYKTMLQCTSKLSSAQWTCDDCEGPIAADGQCTTSVCAWACCASDLVAGTTLWARCKCEGMML